MKKTMFLLGALLLSAAAGHAQESRQDVSISASGNFAPTVHANGTYTSSNDTLGALVSYRYLLTPRSGIEANYGFTQNTPFYHTPAPLSEYIHVRQQEFSGAYVYTQTYKRYNPFVEGGVGAMFFSPIKDFQSQNIDAIKRTTTIGAVFGGGVAYELSPSFDIRAEYRGFLGKTPNLGFDPFTTNRYRVLSMPTIGVAYHF